MKNNLILNKKQDEFHLILSRFSHEIRNPIALINSEIQMIEDTHPEVVSFDYWNDITANLEYTKELLNNPKDYLTMPINLNGKELLLLPILRKLFPVSSPLTSTWALP